MLAGFGRQVVERRTMTRIPGSVVGSLTTRRCLAGAPAGSGQPCTPRMRVRRGVAAAHPMGVGKYTHHRFLDDRPSQGGCRLVRSVRIRASYVGRTGPPQLTHDAPWQ